MCHKFILSKLLESIPVHVILVVVYVIQLLHNLSFTFLSPI